MTQDPGDPDFDWAWTREHPGWIPPSIDVTKPSPARMYDYYLGGKDNFAVDRAAAEEILQLAPSGPQVARANRDFLVHSVEFMADQGITQFLDLGTGIPTSPNVHEVARRTHPQARVVYVDHDPIVLAHARAMLGGTEGAVCVQHDLRNPAGVLDDPEVRRTIDFDRPVGLLMIAVLHFVDLVLAPDVMAKYARRLVSGSYLALSLGTTEDVDPALVERVESVYRRSPSPVSFRSRAQIEQLFEGFTLVEPGLVEVSSWRNPSPPPVGPDAGRMLAGVGRKN